nr:unnamed protein product [Haemonchus contortus]
MLNIRSSSIKMLLCFVYALLLSNVFTAETGPCEDRGPAGLCRRMTRRGECQMGRFVDFSKYHCAKTPVVRA